MGYCFRRRIPYTRPSSLASFFLSLDFFFFCQNCLLTLCYVLQMTGESAQTRQSGCCFFCFVSSFLSFSRGHFTKPVRTEACTAENTNQNQKRINAIDLDVHGKFQCGAPSVLPLFRFRGCALRHGKLIDCNMIDDIARLRFAIIY